jgi:hypothetical protein
MFTADISPGTSGGPIWARASGDGREVIGIAAFDYPDVNGGVRLTEENAETIVAWMRAQPPRRFCAGDCRKDGYVTVDELVSGVAIALGREATSACRAFDRNGDDLVSVNEVVRAVDNALDGCPAS